MTPEKRVNRTIPAWAPKSQGVNNRHCLTTCGRAKGSDGEDGEACLLEELDLTGASGIKVRGEEPQVQRPGSGNASGMSEEEV